MNAPAPVSARHSVGVVTLGKPISVNNAFANNRRGGGRVRTDAYKTWRQAAASIARGFLEGRAKPLPEIKGPVAISLYVPEQGVSPKMDLDNTAKAYLDLLVHLGVIEDDGRKFVRSLHLEWTPGERGAAYVAPLEITP